MKQMIAEIKQAGPSFFIPVQVDDDGEIFTKDVMPVNQQEDEEAYLTEQEKAIAWSEFEYEMQLMERENDFPNTYK